MKIKQKVAIISEKTCCFMRYRKNLLINARRKCYNKKSNSEAMGSHFCGGLCGDRVRREVEMAEEQIMVHVLRKAVPAVHMQTAVQANRRRA